MRRLEPEAITSTADTLRLRVEERFPGRGISQLATELVEISVSTAETTERLARPNHRARVASVVLGMLAVVLLALSATTIGSDPVDQGVRRSTAQGRPEDAKEETVQGWVEFTQAAIQDLVYLVLGGIFLVGLEGRMKRRQALRGLHDLRAFAHIIDMHQLTKDPEFVVDPAKRATAHSPTHIVDRFELERYLDYCAEMLAITSKLAALYAVGTQDPVTLGAVRDVQELTGLLSGTIWQKIVVLDTVSARSATTPPA